MAFIEYAAGRRYDPDTGQVQYNRNGTWQDIGQIQYDPQSGGVYDPRVGASKTPMLPGTQAPVYKGSWGWALPSQEQLRQIFATRNIAGAQGLAAQAAQGPAAAAQQQRSYFGQAPVISTGAGGAPGTGGGGFNVPAGQQPEQAALAQIAQIDPQSEALRQQLINSYLQNLQGGAAPPTPGAVPQPGAMPQFALDLSRGAAAPNAADVQSYLDLYQQIDPQGYAQRAALAGQMGSYLQGAQEQAALGSQLDPGTIREVEQGVRAGQAARGNVYGTPQLVAETMARGTMGEQRRQQRQQALLQALGQQQSYLTSGAGMGDIANQLYGQGYARYLQGYGQQLAAQQQDWAQRLQTQAQTYGQQFQNWQAQQNAIAQRQAAALGYLGSGQTPYQMGASYYDRAQAAAAGAAQGGPQYNPAALGQQYTGAGAPSFPQYGLDMSQLAGNWYNNINAANLQGYQLGQAYGQRGGSGMGAATGALGGAASGALAGSAAGPWGTLIGGAVGAIGGGLSGYSR